jgi:hypothetical protein
MRIVSHIVAFHSDGLFCPLGFQKTPEPAQMSAGMSAVGAKRVAQWVDALDRATTFDAWGQV